MFEKMYFGNFFCPFDLWLQRKIKKNEILQVEAKI